MAGGDLFGPDGIRHFQKLIELDEVIAESTGNRRSPFEIILNKRLYNLLFETVFEIDNVIGNAEQGSDIPRIVHIIERAAAARDSGFRLQFRQTALVPKL